ncbi:hypothetical protein BCR32DRAFT_219335 [Anaeromyces robustus]|uniref:S1 motif domain-containing protein n=1 Tax=Anaeromyces robustus TaxID=1754192 RepID=A0A1Y1X9Z6_9FUNG|nr:hypothetical protein BCR32DRAFT_219335 [Anaeromyces robustus]|eukprot:ORX82563.1 hypothetical protein BCR32DRAFT_219335 [Anaeromyces robustus]
MSATTVTPGKKLGSIQEYEVGPGTYMRNNYIYSSTVGDIYIIKDVNKKLPCISVVKDKEQSAIPEVDSIVTGKIIRVNPKMATLAIMVVGNKPCKDDFQGIIRVQDVRSTEKDKVQIYRSFRPGDIVRARVISLGDRHSYYLTTAENELGVIFAQSISGETMIPISWQQMICPKTKVMEYRKCAKPN